ncbi:MAG: 6-phosphofructokinase [Bacteroidetes bacterium]|nr:6-phosphofructokinase [Bacteroidota bacterium]
MLYENPNIRKIAVLTSGGDAPGMNAAIRAVVRATNFYGKESIAVYRGYDGLIEGDFETLTARSVSNIIQRGGTILKTARCKGFFHAEGRAKAAENLRAHDIDALIVIGGDGTFRGATALYEEHGICVAGIPGTIDNDLAGTDYTIGYDTACNTVITAIDAIRDTASSHHRLFFIEVMGRDAGFIALRAAIAGGVEAVLIPEHMITTDELIKKLETGAKNKKSSSLVIVAEGGKSGNAMEIAQKVDEQFSYYDTKVTVLGHVQRGGTPSCLDREIAGRMGVGAVEAILSSKTGVMVGIINNEIAITSFAEVVKTKKSISLEMFRINEILAV